MTKTLDLLSALHNQATDAQDQAGSYFNELTARILDRINTLALADDAASLVELDTWLRDEMEDTVESFVDYAVNEQIFPAAVAAKVKALLTAKQILAATKANVLV